MQINCFERLYCIDKNYISFEAQPEEKQLKATREV